MSPDCHSNKNSLPLDFHELECTPLHCLHIFFPRPNHVGVWCCCQTVARSWCGCVCGGRLACLLRHEQAVGWGILLQLRFKFRPTKCSSLVWYEGTIPTNLRYLKLAFLFLGSSQSQWVLDSCSQELNRVRCSQETSRGQCVERTANKASCP